METKELICINCPLGCGLTVIIEDGCVKSVEGNTCPKGKEYGVKEITNPTRIVTTSVKIMNGTLPVVSVKTASDIPKEKIKECVRALKDVCIPAPVKIGEILLSNVCDTGVDIVATKNIEEKNYAD